ncbi:hypothetical protein SJ05684_c04630 [Sinorhizobium sojae CCBAU 05684]|uniref:Uncharacterized protein n=1 Tax=Sinorhizobium sojae CCBAU 05684 TaxID=716928 RepID=A0A249P9J4_9HYPH|nr:hypothetical protein SJ05684_c04630 [Sinorhizobium sojae CCBAU 05684]
MPISIALVFLESRMPVVSSGLFVLYGREDRRGLFRAT